jgi:hypothetical protein
VRVLSAFLVCAPLAAQPAAAPLSFLDQLRLVADLDQLWQPPRLGARCVLFSSYDRRSGKGPGDPQAWFANDDAGQYLRIDTRDTRPEYVLVEAEGPGVVVRFWSANPSGDYRFYFDGEPSPSWTIAAQELLGGRTAPFVEPLAGSRSGSGHCLVPIPFARRLKVTCSEGGARYQVNVRLLAQGTRCETFNPLMLQDHAAALEALRKRLRSPKTSAGKTLAGTRLAVDGPTVVRRLAARLVPPAGLERAEVGRSVLLVATIDGHETIRVPVDDFFGAGPDAQPARTWVTAFGSDGLAECLLPIPIRERATFELVREGKAAAVEAMLTVQHEPQAVGLGALTLHAAWHQRRDVPSRPWSEHLVLDTKGPGRLAGFSLFVRNPSRSWWGEGDDKVRVDGEEFPSLFGTGTGDCFGFGQEDARSFQGPFQSLLLRGGEGHSGTLRASRFQVADHVPFQRSLRFDLEVWHTDERCRVDYTTVAYWYAPVR